MEEIDLCWRAKLSGEEVWVVPQSHIYHVGGGTLPNNSPRKLYLNFRNNLLMMEKNLPDASRNRIIFTRMCIDGAAAAAYLLMGKVPYFKAVWNAHKDYRKMKGSVVRTPHISEVPRPRGSVFFM
jgi:GT2 family glycosyltransferase